MGLPFKGDRIAFIVNPESRSGETGRNWPGIRRMAEDRLGNIRVSLTSGPGDAGKRAGDYLRQGARLVVCVGGDGTLNEVVNGILEAEAPLREEAVLGYVPCGTGCDFARSVSIPRDPADALDMIAGGRTRPVDVGRISCDDGRGGRPARYFDNAVSFGIGGAVVSRLRGCSRYFGPRSAYLLSIVLSVLLEGRRRVRLGLDDRPEETFTAWHVVAANGQYQGKALRVAPGARVDDGLLDITVFGDISLSGVFRHLPKVYGGRIDSIEEVFRAKGKKVKASSDEEVLVEADGELIGRLPAEIDLLPRAIRVIAGPEPP